MCGGQTSKKPQYVFLWCLELSKLQAFEKTKHTHASFPSLLEGGGAVSLASAAVSLGVCSAHKSFPVPPRQANQMTEPTRFCFNHFLYKTWKKMYETKSLIHFCSGFFLI